MHCCPKSVRLFSFASARRQQVTKWQSMSPISLLSPVCVPQPFLRRVPARTPEYASCGIAACPPPGLARGCTTSSLSLYRTVGELCGAGAIKQAFADRSMIGAPPAGPTPLSRGTLVFGACALDNLSQRPRESLHVGNASHWRGRRWCSRAPPQEADTRRPRRTRRTLVFLPVLYVKTAAAHRLVITS